MNEAKVRFDVQRSGAQNWFNRSSDLRLAAATLWTCNVTDVAAVVVKTCDLDSANRTSIFSRPVYFMLCGLSLELLFKAILVARAAPPPPSHSLTELCALTHLDVSAQDRVVLKVLTGSVVWFGKYPVPKKAEDLDAYAALVRSILFTEEALGSKTILTPSGALDWPRFDSLWKKGAKVFFSALRAEAIPERT